MKKKLILNKSIIIVFLILIIWCLITGFTTFKNLNNKDCDTITLFFYILAFSNLSMLQIISPIFIIYICASKFNKEIHTGSIKNFLTRESYKKYLKKVFKYPLKISIVLPLAMLFLFLCCFILTKNFNFENAMLQILGYTKDGSPVMTGTISPINLEFYNTPVKLMLTFFLVIYLHSLMYSNIGIIMSLKCKNFSLSIISSFLIFIVLCLFSELVLGYIFIRKMNFTNLNSIFNLFGIWVYSEFEAFLPLIVYSIILVILSYIAVFFVYKNEEGVIIESEK